MGNTWGIKTLGLVKALSIIMAIIRCDPDSYRDRIAKGSAQLKGF